MSTRLDLKRNPWVFDCDGVILDSNRIKTQAFHAVIQPLFGNAEAQKMVDYHVANGGVSRFKKFAWFLESIGEFNSEKHHELCESYGDCVRDELMKAPLTKGVEDFLDVLRHHRRTVYVVSGGLQEELRNIFRQRNLDKYFGEIYGSPRDKIQILEEIKTQFTSLESGVFFGDAKADFDAAKYFRMNFVFVKAYSEANAWFERQWVDRKHLGYLEWIDDFSQIGKVVDGY